MGEADGSERRIRHAGIIALLNVKISFLYMFFINGYR